MKARAESQSANFAKGERVALLRPGYRGQVGRVRGLTKDGQRFIVNLEHGFSVAVLGCELKRRIEP